MAETACKGGDPSVRGRDSTTAGTPATDEIVRRIVLCLSANLHRWRRLVASRLPRSARPLADADDILQDAFVVACGQMDKLRGLQKAQVRLWFATVLMRTVRDRSRFYRRLKRFPSRLAEESQGRGLRLETEGA
jgi:DNA-directed RNA polymerase specialized sigma24 family protein